MVIEFVHQAEWKPTPLPRRLTAAQIDAFYADGYLVLDDLFDANELQEITTASR